MKKTIIISGIACNFKSSAALPRMYRLKFRRDLFVDLNNLKKQVEVNQRMQEEMESSESDLPIDSLEIFENIAFLMHKHGDPNQPKDIDEWLEQFETFDIYEVLPEILSLWNMDNEQMSEPKKENGK